MSPPSPADAVPVPIDISPDAPHVVVPVLNISSPLTPATPAFKVRIIIVPLVDFVPNPLIMEIEPPVASFVPTAFDLPAYR